MENTNNTIVTDFVCNGYTYTEEKTSGNYGRTVTLCSFPDIKITNLSAEGFAAVVKAALELACKKYMALVTPELEEYNKKLIEDKLKYVTMQAEKKWKTAATREEHINSEMKAYKEAVAKSKPASIFFSFCPGPHHGVPGICHGLTENTTTEQLIAVYNLLMEKNEWFRKGTGLKFKYDTGSNEKSHSASSFGIIELLMSDEDKAAEIAGQKALDEDIRKFYANCRYCGD